MPLSSRVEGVPHTFYTACGLIAIIAAGAQAQTPVVSLSPTSLTWGSYRIGTSSGVRSVVLSNTGSGVLNISSITITGTASGDFTQTNTCGSLVGAGANCTINITFSPKGMGSR